MLQHEDGDSSLLATAKHGDQNAQAALLEQYRNYLRLVARLHIDRVLRSKLDESDLVQETYFQAHRDFESFRGTTEAELTKWLRQIMAHSSGNLIRHFATQRRDVRREQSLFEEIDQTSQVLNHALVADDPSPSEQAGRRERAVILADALAQLPDDYREVIILHHLEGKTLKHVAQLMARSVDSAKKLWSRALVELRVVMQEIMA